METTLADGLTLRPATTTDLPQVAELLATRGEAADAVDVELVAASAGPETIGVVVDGDRVVSTATLLDETVHLAGIATPAGQVELVATDVAYEHRGLVRALMGWAHSRSSTRGHLLQVMIGIPYFYRAFGYEYVQPMPTWRRLGTTPPAAPGASVRRATSADLPDLQRLQDAAQAPADVRMPHGPSCWSWLLAHDATELWVAERAGRPIGMARTVPPGEGAALAELAADTDEAAFALLADAADRAAQHGDVGPIAVAERIGHPPSVTGLLAEPVAPTEWYYARVERPAELLAHLAPVLRTRLVHAGLDGSDHEVLLSTWRRHLRFRIGPSGLQVVADGGPEQAPVSKGGSGVPPDAMASLLVGAYGALGLEQRLPDCLLGRQRDLMAALFPPLRADLLTFYLPQ